MSDPWMAAFLGRIFEGDAGGDLGFGGANINVTNQVQANPTIVNGADGDVSVTNVQANATEQDISGAGLNLGDGDAGGGLGFGGININVTNQIQANPTIVHDADGDVSVFNAQGNVTGQDISGAGFNFGELGLA